MNPDNLPLALIPGFMLDETLWDAFVAEFPPSRTFVRASLREGETIAEMARHIVSTLPPRFVLVGFSLGGYIARSIVEQFPQSVAGLVLVATSLREDSEEQQQIKTAAIKAVSGPTFRGISTGAIAATLHPSRAQDHALIAQIRAMGAQLGADVFRRQASLVRGKITRHPIECPTLVIAAADDPSRPLAELQELHQSIAGSTLALIEQCGHMVPLEQPGRLAETISEWLAKQRESW
ncbi:alpha/beta hydrolase [Klebsiella aerogenes]|nr:alpha/beta hydrolase [Klebsiella aerogenes]